MLNIVVITTHQTVNKQSLDHLHVNFMNKFYRQIKKKNFTHLKFYNFTNDEVQFN